MKNPFESRPPPVDAAGITSTIRLAIRTLPENFDRSRIVTHWLSTIGRRRLLRRRVEIKRVLHGNPSGKDSACERRTRLNALGLDYRVEGYDVHVSGGQTPRVQGAIPTFGDHRLSMTAHVLLLAHGLKATILEGHCYQTSFPGFAQCLDRLTGREA